MMIRNVLSSVLLVVAVAMMFLVPFAGASTSPCADGTAYFKCSTTQPGYACMPDSASGTNTLQIYMKDAQGRPTKCACSNFPGYVEQNGQCVKAVCNIGSETIQNGQCYAKTFQKCTNGQLVEDPTCGCPAGKKPSTDNKICVEKTEGCRWIGSIKCLSYQECKFDANNANDDGTCNTKNGCQYAQYNNQNCNTEVETCNVATGKCDKLSGKCASNSDCGSGKTCNLISHACEATVTGLLGDAQAPLLGGNAATPDNSGQSSENGGKKGGICCLPISIGMAGVGLAFIRRKGEN